MSEASDTNLPPVGRVYLETERLILRQFTTADVELLFDLDSDPEVMRYVGGISPSRDEIEQDYIPAYLEYYARGDRFGFWAVIEKATGDFLGWFHFRPDPDGHATDPDLGYRLRRITWGKGYATEGSLALVRKGFEELGVERVTASAYAENTASRRVMEKLGMTLERTFYFADDDPSGAAVEYALTKEDWQKQQFALR